MAYHPYHFVGEVLLHPVYLSESNPTGDRTRAHRVISNDVIPYSFQYGNYQRNTVSAQLYAIR